MTILVELLEILEEKKKKGGKPSRSMRQKVYHADYVKTKHKPYRRYDEERPEKG